MPDRCLSQLRERFGFGSGGLRTGAARQARRGQPPCLLLATDWRCGHRFVKPDLRPGGTRGKKTDHDVSRFPTEAELDAAATPATAAAALGRLSLHRSPAANRVR